VIGQVVGTLRLLEELGTGGMGTVYLAETEDEPGKKVAVKVIHPHLVNTPRGRKRFLREGEIGRRIRHRNVVATYGVDELELDGKPALYLTMEYVEGQTLRSLLSELGRVPEELCRHVGTEVVKALTAVHAVGVVHRDLKPENVLVTRDQVVKVMDLGIARLEDETIGLSQTGMFVGSVRYAAPEQFRSQELDGRSDLYALGLVLYELATGKHPFPGEDVAAVVQRHLHEAPRPPALINPQLSPFFEEVVKTLLAKDRNERFASAAELQTVLEEGEQSEWWKERAQSIRDATQRPLRRIRIPRTTALYGRANEMARLRALYERAKAGHGQVVIVDGEAGIGKTRLVDEFVTRLREDGEELSFLFGSYPPGGAATAAYAFADAYREHIGDAGLESALAEHLTVTPGLIPAFAALLRGEAPPAGHEPLAKDSLQAVFVHSTRALAERRPTVLLIDDLHFAPEAGRALFAALALALSGHRLLLVGTSRPGLPEDWIAQLERLEHASRLSLGRLGPKDLARLLMDAFGSVRLAQDLAYRIGTKSDGNPFFAFEIIRGLREGQFIQQQPDGTWIKTQMIEDIRIPDSVRDLIQARIADLDDEERHLLEVASCCGYDFDPRLIGEVLGMGRIPALQRLGRIEKSHRLIRSAGPRYVFDHHQVQESLYEGLAQPLREEYHAALAEALEAREHAEDSAGPAAVELCRHFFDGARPKRALPYLATALEHLEEGDSNRAALELMERALHAPGLVTGRERLDLLFRARALLDLLGLRARERGILEEALSLADETGDPALCGRAQQELGGHHFRTGGYHEARARFMKALRLAREAGDRRLEAQATGNLGGVFFDLGLFEDARVHHERHRRLAQEIGDRRSEAQARGNLGIALKNLGRVAEAREHMECHLALAREAGDRRGEAIAAGNLGLVHMTEGRWEESLDYLGHCLEMSREIGFRQGEASAIGNLGNVFFYLGRVGEALERHTSHEMLSRETGDRRGETIASGNVGIVLMSLGALSEAGEQLERFLRLSRTFGDRRSEAIALDVLGRLRSWTGNTAAARSDLDRSLAIHREIGYLAGEAATLVTLGRLEVAQGDDEAATACFEGALAVGRALEVPGTVLVAESYRARLPGGDPQPALEALAEYEARVGHGDRMEARHCLWQATENVTHLDAALNLLLRLREHAPEERRASLMEKVPLHRAIATARR
jgi:tetratricopeptide (TPR) repeat protein